MTLMEAMKALYESEINVSVSSFWDGGWEVEIGDAMNGFKSSKNFDNDKLDDAGPWLAAEVTRLYPDSAFAKEYA